MYNFGKYSINKNTLWPKLIGSADVFSLESRIFHSISVGLILLNSIYIPYNLFAGLYVASFSGLIFGLIFFYQYYSSRIKSKPHSNMLFALTGLLIFGINYFTNSGIDGSTDLIWPAYLLLVFAISPYKQHLPWLIVFLLCFWAIHTIEFYYPFLIKHPFSAGIGQFTDRITVFPIPVLVIYMVIKFIRRSYDKEKQATEEKTIAVEKSNTEKNKLMSIISHDLRSPLVTIQSYLELLKDKEIESSERPALEQSLLQSTNHALEMLSNLLNWSKSQMEGSNVKLVEANLLTVLKGTLEMEQINASKKDIKLQYQISPQINVIADVDMLQLVIRNIITNAIKFTANGGTVKIDAELINTECKISVIDNGKGMPTDKQQDIFSIKTTASYGTNNEKGVGLGLVLCKEFIERQGGKIGFESKEAIGSTFFIFLPISNSTTQDS